MDIGWHHLDVSTKKIRKIFQFLLTKLCTNSYSLFSFPLESTQIIYLIPVLELNCRTCLLLKHFSSFLFYLQTSVSFGMSFNLSPTSETKFLPHSNLSNHGIMFPLHGTYLIPITNKYLLSKLINLQTNLSINLGDIPIN